MNKKTERLDLRLDLELKQDLLQLAATRRQEVSALVRQALRCYVDLAAIGQSDAQRLRAGAANVPCVICSRHVDPNSTWHSTPEEAVICAKCADKLTR